MVFSVLIKTQAHCGFGPTFLFLILRLVVSQTECVFRESCCVRWLGSPFRVCQPLLDCCLSGGYEGDNEPPALLPGVTGQ